MKKTLVKYLSILIFAIFLVIPEYSYSVDTTLTQVKLQLKWKHQFQFAGYYAAIEKGFYKDLGIEVELLEANSAELPIDALLNGKAEFATSTSDIILLRAEGKPIVLLATIFQHSAQILLTKETSGIKYVHNLAGKKLIIEPHAADIIAYMSNENVTLNKVIQLPNSFDINMLLENKADAMTAYLTDEPFLLKEQNIDYNILSPVSGNIDFYGDILVTSEKLLLDNSKLAEDFRKASLKGWEYAMKNTPEIIELIYNKYSKRHSKAHLVFEAEEMQKIMIPEVVAIGYSNPERWQKIIKTYQETGILHENANIEGLFYTDYINKTKIPWNWLAIFSLALSFFVAISVFFYKQSGKLKKEIKHRKKIHNTLIESEKKYKILSENAIMPVILHDIDGTVKYVNNAAVRVLKAKNKEELYKLSIISFLHPDYVSKVTTGVKEIYSEKINFHAEQKIKRLDGKYIDIEVSGELTHFDNKKVVQITFNDITDRKKAEIALKESESKLKEINKTKDKFFSIIAHDLKSPFSSILGFTELLNKNFDTYTIEKQKDFLSFIHQEIQKTYNLLDDLLTWARSQTGSINFNSEKINLYLSISRSIEFSIQAAESKNIKIANQINANIVVNVDENMLSTIIRNLISNAIKFTPKEGKITISTSENKLPFIEISIRDTGVGIPKEAQAKLFDISQNTSTQGTENETGTGLGLILCKEFVEKHGGKIWVESEEAKGSEFIFTLPFVL